MSIATEIQRLQTAKADIKAAIEQKGITVGDGRIDTYASKIAEIIYSEDYSKYATTMRFADLNLFGKPNVVVNLENVSSLGQLCYQKAATKNTTVEHLTINCPNQVISMGSAFYAGSEADSVLKKITLNVDTQKATDWSGFTSNRRKLEVIDGTPLDLSSATNVTNILSNNYALKEVRFKGIINININFSTTTFSAESVDSIITALADLSQAETKTITLRNTVGSNLTDGQRAIITQKNWTLVY